MFTHDAAAPTSGGGSTLLPAGLYDLVITKAEVKASKKGYPMVNVTCEVLNNVDYNGARVFHNVTFLPKDAPGAGMSSHFLKCINQPFEGPINVESEKWVGESFKAKIAPRKYTKKDGTEAETNDLKEIFATEDAPF